MGGNYRQRQAKKLSGQLPMGTILEGEWNEVMAVVTACFNAMSTDCNRIRTHIKIDYRVGPDTRMKAKVDAVEKALGRKLSRQVDESDVSRCAIATYVTDVNK